MIHYAINKIDQCCPVKTTEHLLLPNFLMSGASLMISGLVPKTTNVFICFHF